MVDAYETDLRDQLVVAHLFLRLPRQTVLDHHVLLEVGQIDLVGEELGKLEEDERRQISRGSLNLLIIDSSR